MQTIDLPTVQHVTISYTTASLGERCLALLIDLAIIGFSYLLFFLTISRLFTIDWNGFMPTVFLFFLPLLYFFSYHFLFELFNHGQSLGKRWLKLQVVRTDGEPVAMGDYVLRTMFYFVDFIATAGILGALFIHGSAQRQRLGDLLAGTSVIKLKSSAVVGLKDLLRINSLDSYEPIYPSVRQFSEADMLLIKDTLDRAQRYQYPVNQQLLKDLAERLVQQLQLGPIQQGPKEFLVTLIKDYIVLTR